MFWLIVLPRAKGPTVVGGASRVFLDPPICSAAHRRLAATLGHSSVIVCWLSCARCLNLAQLCEASGDRSHMAPVTRMSPAVLSSDCEGFLDQLRYFHWLSSLPLGAMWLSLAVLVQCGKGAASYGNAVFSGQPNPI